MLDTDSKAQLITRDPEIMSGAPVFKGTRVPVKTLIDFLQGGHDLDEFLTEYPSVTREQAIGVLQLAKQLLITRLHENPAWRESSSWTSAPIPGP